MTDDRIGINRRGFLKMLGAAGVGAAIAAPSQALAAGQTKFEGKEGGSTFLGLPKRKLGKTGVEVPILCGAGDFDFEEKEILLEKSYEWGVHTSNLLLSP